MTETLNLILLKLGKLDKIEEDIQVVHLRLDRLECGMEKLQERMEALESKVEVLESSVEVLKGDVTKLKAMERKIDRLSVLVESEIRRMINVVAEGHGVLHHRMDDVMDLYRDKERMEIELIDLRINVNDVKQEIALA